MLMFKQHNKCHATSSFDLLTVKSVMVFVPSLFIIVLLHEQPVHIGCLRILITDGATHRPELRIVSFLRPRLSWEGLYTDRHEVWGGGRGRRGPPVSGVVLMVVPLSLPPPSSLSQPSAPSVSPATTLCFLALAVRRASSSTSSSKSSPRGNGVLRFARAAASNTSEARTTMGSRA
jgi:hypothetical protein